MPKLPTLYCLTHTHKYGEDVTVYVSDSDRDRAYRGQCFEEAQHVGPDDETPENVVALLISEEGVDVMSIEDDAWSTIAELAADGEREWWGFNDHHIPLGEFQDFVRKNADAISSSTLIELVARTIVKP